MSRVGGQHLNAVDPRVIQLKAVNRLIRAKEAHDSLLAYAQFMTPDTADIEDATKSRYEITPQARLISEIVERAERQKLLRVAISIGPQMGKSQVISRFGPAWISGRNPYRHMILGSYNQDFANDFGTDVKHIMESPAHKQVFPEFQLASAATDHIITSRGGKLAFVGVGGSGSGKPADMFVVDDPYRNDEDANSATYREKVWKWFNSVVFARCHDKTAIIIVHTRWHEDDLIGRLCDPDHPERNGLYRGIEKRWTYINIPAVITDERLAKALGLELDYQTDPDIVEQFGTEPMCALWEGRKSLPLLAEAKQNDKVAFTKLNMGKPSPDEGDYFLKSYLLTYRPEDLPKNLRFYGASDHAVSKKQKSDSNCIGCVGIDEDDDLWVMPDLVWRKMKTDKVVEELLMQFKMHTPFLWWLEDELISKSFGPFLKKRMLEERIYTTLDPIVPSQDLELRARSIQGRMSMGKVHFPVFAPWWASAEQQLLKFPSASHDDFVAWLALIGLGLLKNVKPGKPKPKVDKSVRVGSIQWILREAKKRAHRQKIDDFKAGW